MTLEEIRAVFAWNAVLNFLFLFAWVAFYLAAHDFMYRMHSRLFRLSREDFDSIHYRGMAYYKILIMTFILGPYLAMRIVG